MENSYPSKENIAVFMANEGCIKELAEEPVDADELRKYLNSYRYHFEKRELREYLVIHIGFSKNSANFAEKVLTNLFPNLNKPDVSAYIPESGRMSDRMVVFPLNAAARNFLKMQ